MRSEDLPAAKDVLIEEDILRGEQTECTEEGCEAAEIRRTETFRDCFMRPRGDRNLALSAIDSMRDGSCEQSNRSTEPERSRRRRPVP